MFLVVVFVRGGGGGENAVLIAASRQCFLTPTDRVNHADYNRARHSQWDTDRDLMINIMISFMIKKPGRFYH